MVKMFGRQALKLVEGGHNDFAAGHARQNDEIVEHAMNGG